MRRERGYANAIRRAVAHQYALGQHLTRRQKHLLRSMLRRAEDTEFFGFRRNTARRDGCWNPSGEIPRHPRIKRIGEEDIVRALWINDPEGKHLRVPCA